MDTNTAGERNIPLSSMRNTVSESVREGHLTSKILSKGLQSLPFGVQLFDVNGDTLYINLSQMELLRINGRPESIQKVNVRSHPVSQISGRSQLFQLTLESGKEQIRTFSARTEGSSDLQVLKTYQEKMIPVKNEVGEIDHIMSVTMDISFEVQNRMGLQASEKRYEELIRRSNYIYYSFDTDAGYHRFSDRAVPLTGFTPQELTSAPDFWLSRVHPEDRDQLEQALDCEQGTQPEEVIYRFCNKDGSWIWMRDHIVLRKRVQGKWMTDGYVEDITSEKRLENQIHKLNHQFEMLLRGSQYNLWDWNLKTAELYLSPGWKAQLGYEDGELENDFLILYELLHPDDLQTVMNALNDISSAKVKEIDLVYRMQHSNGEWLSFSCHATLHRNIDGEMLRVTGTHSLIESEEARIQRLIDKISNKDQLMSVIGHDLRSSFTAVEGLAELAELKLGSQQIEESGEYLSMIRQATKNGTELLNNLLNWSRIQSGRLTYDPISINVSECVDHSLASLHLVAEKKGVFIHNEIPNNVVIRGDLHMLSTILRNLFSNSIKYCSAGGYVKAIHIRRKQQDQFVFEDNGVGIEPDKLNTLFTQDHIASTHGTGGEKGSGIGLQLCREMAGRNGWILTAESDPGVRTRFILSCPIKQEKDGAK